MEAFPNNTDERKVSTIQTVKKEEKQVDLPDPIVSGEVKKKKQTFGDKAKRLLFKEDIKSVWSYIFGDILVPALKSTLLNTVQNGAEFMIMGGVSNPKRSSSNGGRVSRVPYSTFYEDEDYKGRTRKAYSIPTNLYDEIEFDHRDDAEAVLMRCRQRILEFGSVSIAHLYSLVGWKSDWTANQYGWLNLDQANVIRTGMGTFVLKLPRPVEL